MTGVRAKSIRGFEFRGEGFVAPVRLTGRLGLQADGQEPVDAHAEPLKGANPLEVGQS